MAGKETRSANQAAGIQSGLTEKTPIPSSYVPREQNEKNGRPQSQKAESAGEFKIK